jgi:hypothetical protein
MNEPTRAGSESCVRGAGDELDAHEEGEEGLALAGDVLGAGGDEEDGRLDLDADALVATPEGEGEPQVADGDLGAAAAEVSGAELGEEEAGDRREATARSSLFSSSSKEATA